MKSKRKALLLLMCAVLLVASSVFGTIAYLTDSEAVANTFTVGQIHITMDEADVNTAGQKLNSEGGVYKDGDTLADRVTANSYHLLPGQTYTKDPIIHVDDESENCYLFVKVENEIENIETGVEADTIRYQLAKFGWRSVPYTTNIYALDKDSGFKCTVSAGKDVNVFESFTIDGDKVVNVGDGETVPAGKIDLSDYKNAKVTITAYAVQAAGFDNAEAAWNATFGK